MSNQIGKITTSIFQCDAKGLKPSERIERVFTVAKTTNADLIVCPELFLSGYNVGTDIREYAEPVDGEFARAISKITKATNTAIVYGYPELAGEVLYNSAQCIDANGVSLANHRKTVLPPGFEREYFSIGQSTTIFTIHGIKLGLLICYECEFPESVRTLAESGVQIVIVPTALVRKWALVPHKLIPTRAFENGVFVVYSNHAGTENASNYVGASCIIDPSGDVLARAEDGEEIITAELEVSAVISAQNRIPYLIDSKLLRDS